MPRAASLLSLAAVLTTCIAGAFTLSWWLACAAAAILVLVSLTHNKPVYGRYARADNLGAQAGLLLASSLECRYCGRRRLRRRAGAGVGVARLARQAPQLRQRIVPDISTRWAGRPDDRHLGTLHLRHESDAPCDGTRRRSTSLACGPHQRAR